MTVSIRRSLRQSQAAGIRACLCQPTDCADSDGCAKDLHVMMINLIFEARLSDLVQAVKVEDCSALYCLREDVPWFDLPAPSPELPVAKD